MPNYEDDLALISAAETARRTADENFEARKTEFEALAAEHAKLHGAPALGTISALAKTYGPKIATYFGLPGLAAGLTATAADPGAFGVLRGIAGKFLGLFGFGG